jgi:hypothetical protein
MPAGVTYSSLGVDTPALNVAGETTFLAAMTGAGITANNDSALWTGRPGNITLLAREGDPAPGMGAGVGYSSFNSNIALNAAGQSAFTGLVAGPGVTLANDGAVWIAGAGGTTLLAREGNQAPGAPVDVNFSAFYAPLALNEAGRATFLAGVTGPGITTRNNQGLWSGTPGNLGLLARLGDPPPDTHFGPKYTEFGKIVLNRNGRNAFCAEALSLDFIAPPAIGIWAGQPGSVSKLVATNDPAPGAGDGVSFGNLLRADLAINGQDEIVFLTSLLGSGVTAANDRSLWFANAGGDLSMIVREGSLFEAGPGDLRTIATLTFEGGSGDQDGFRSAFNDAGQVVFGATFTDDSSGIFVAQVPEPGSTILFMLGAASVLSLVRVHPSARRTTNR